MRQNILSLKQVTKKKTASEKPTEVLNALRLIFVSIAVSILNTISDFSYLASLTSANSLLFQMIGTYAIIIFLTIKIVHGRNWARIIFLIIFVFGLPASIPSLYSHFSRSLLACGLMLLTTILQLAAIILLFQKQSNAWFAHLKHLEEKDLV